MRTYDDLILEAKARIGYLLDYKDTLERRLTDHAAGRESIKVALRETNEELRKLDFMILQKTQLEATQNRKKPPLITDRMGLKFLSREQLFGTQEIYLRDADGGLTVYKSKQYAPGTRLDYDEGQVW